MNRKLKYEFLYENIDQISLMDDGWGYIYMIRNIVNDKFYIGSTFYPKTRFKSHINALNNNTHRNKFLQKAWNKYGMKNFRFSIVISIFDRNQIKLIEQRYLDIYFNCFRHKLYNLNYKADNGGFAGRKHTEETKNIMRMKRIGVSLCKGTQNPNSKLNDNKVREIRELYNSNKFKIVELSRLYNVSTTVISGIVKYKFWKHI